MGGVAEGSAGVLYCLGWDGAWVVEPCSGELGALCCGRVGLGLSMIVWSLTSLPPPLASQSPHNQPPASWNPGAHSLMLSARWVLSSAVLCNRGPVGGVHLTGKNMHVS